MASFDDVSGDNTVLSTRYLFREATDMVSRTHRFISFEVGAMVGMELCERHIEGFDLDPDSVWIDAIGHLIIGRKRKAGSSGNLGQALVLLRSAVHPAGHGAFDRVLEAATMDEGRSADLRERFAAVLYPIDRASARFSLARCIELAFARSQRPGRPSKESIEIEADGLGPDSLEVVLSNLDETALRVAPRELQATPSRSRERFGPEPEEQAPHRLGRFAVFGEIARGGMAQVLLARDPRDGGRPCVIKRMLPNLAKQESFTKMFKDEAALGLCLEHRHICRTLAFSEIDDELCIKMEWAAGLNLSELLTRASQRKEPLSIGFVLRLGEALATALSYAHDAKGPDGRALRVVHRDVSPQNVVIQYDGAIKLLDFGVARSAVQTEGSVGGQVKGKFAYMSPEQSLGMPIDDRSDVFCVGICLFEALTCRPLFDRDDRLAIVRALARGELPDVTSRRGDVPEHVASLLRRALASQVELRPRMNELATLLREAQLLVECRPDEVTATVRRLDPDWRSWRGKLNPFVRNIPLDPRHVGPTRPWKALLGEEEGGTDTDLDSGAVDLPAPDTKTTRSVKLAGMETERLERVEARPRARWLGPLLFVLGAIIAAAIGWWASQLHRVPPMSSSPPELGTDSQRDQVPTPEPVGGSAPAVAQPDPASNDEPTSETSDDEPELGEPSTPEVNQAVLPTVEDGFGSLLVRTEPSGARVFLDGEVLRGRTPKTYDHIAAGNHRLLIRLPGHAPLRRWVRIQPDRGALLRLELTPR